ncbi:peptide chain release factor N(5)-glutamine methyltransferase [Acetivibrio cellulolyticus]|uniref:peptide chain release factor N(5)-glutamine methyltransferase n=1 Tax=Acetivibrio cellulolyticus TaxID=35830 RepID=UPI0001E2F5C8|nr:peptide chain release factor N(5)-glutamine methyltransferase [Acetivibrio cellulolyticus]
MKVKINGNVLERKKKVILKQAFTEGSKMLKLSNIEAPVVTAGAILCHVLGCDKAYLYSHDDYILNNSQFNSFLEAIKRRINGEPLQYITGSQEFMSLDFIVSPDVLIPRQDTEILVESVIQFASGKGNIDILDVGTGSGCIAISLAYFIKNSRVTAVDISKGALEMARKNAQKCGVEDRITFIESNLFDNVTSGDFDIIVSNPPYIPVQDIETLEKQVKDFEPRSALDGGCDGLDFYRRITKDSIRYLKPNGLLAFEVGYDQSQEVLKIMKDSFDNLKIERDLAGIERVVMGIRSK